MNNQKWKEYAFWIIFTEAVGLIAGLLTRNATGIYSETILKPALSPPAVLFPIVWAILYALMGIGIARVRLNANTKDGTAALGIYILQLFFNFAWSFIFFSFQAFGFAFLWLAVLWVLILIMIIRFSKTDKAAAFLQIPYLIWVSFAGYLNLGVWLLN